MGRECGKRRGEMRLAATRTSNRIAIMTNQFLEFGSTIFTNVFKDRHFYSLRTPRSFCTILPQRGGWRWGGEGAQIFADLIAHPAKQSEALLFAAFERGGVFERAMKCEGCSGKQRAVVFRVIANREDVIEVLVLELANVLGAVAGDIDAQLAHNGDCLRAKMAWFGSCAGYFEPIAGEVAQEALGYLAPG